MKLNGRDCSDENFSSPNITISALAGTFCCCNVDDCFMMVIGLLRLLTRDILESGCMCLYPGLSVLFDTTPSKDSKYVCFFKPINIELLRF